MGEQLFRIGNYRWPIIGKFDIPAYVSKDGRTWRGLLEFRAFNLYLEYSETDNPHMFAGTGLEGTINPGCPLEIDPPNQAIFPNAGTLVVHLTVQQRMDYTLSTEEIKVLGEIYNAIEGRDKVAVPSPQPKARKKGSVGPRWGEEERRRYDVKIHELISAGESNRGVARKTIIWAKANSDLKNYKIPTSSSIEKWAQVEREKNFGTRRKRMN